MTHIHAIAARVKTPGEQFVGSQRELALLDAQAGGEKPYERLLGDAKELALGIAGAGYSPPLLRTDIPAPGENILATLRLGVRMMREGEYISDHDVKVANKVAHVLCGGAITPGTPVSEQYLLDLEREAFKSLCGEKKTQERIQYTLKTGKVGQASGLSLPHGANHERRSDRQRGTHRGRQGGERNATGHAAR